MQVALIGYVWSKLRENWSLYWADRERRDMAHKASGVEPQSNLIASFLLRREDKVTSRQTLFLHSASIESFCIRRAWRNTLHNDVTEFPHKDNYYNWLAAHYSKSVYKKHACCPEGYKIADRKWQGVLSRFLFTQDNLRYPSNRSLFVCT